MAKKFSSDEQAMIQILHSMGIEDFEANVPAALNDYARRECLSVCLTLCCCPLY